MPAGGGGPDGGLRWAAGVLGELRAGGGGAELGRALRRLEDPPGGARAGDFLGALLGPPEPALRAGAGGPPGAHPRGLLGTAPPALQARAVVLLRAAAPLLPRSDLHRALAGLAAPQAVAVSPPARALAAAALGELRGEAPAGAAGGPGDDKLPAGLRGLVQRDRGSLPTLPWAHSARLADLRPAAPAGAGPRGEPPAAEPAARAGLEATPAPPCDALEALERALEGGEGGGGGGGRRQDAALEQAAAELLQAGGGPARAPPRPLLEALAHAAGRAPDSCVRLVLEPVLARGGSGHAGCELARALVRDVCSPARPQGRGSEPDQKRARRGVTGGVLDLVLAAVVESPGWPADGRLGLTSDLVSAGAAAGGLSGATVAALAGAVERASLSLGGSDAAQLVKLVAHVVSKLGTQMREHREQLEAAVATTATFLTKPTLQKLRSL